MKGLGVLHKRNLLLLLLLSAFNPGAEGCTGNVQADMVFMIDASGSVGSGNFQTMLAFVRDLINDFDVASDKIRIGVEKFSSSPNTEFNLNWSYDKTTIMNQVSATYYSGGGTDTGTALEYMRNNMFTSGSGDRANVPNIGVVLSDGISNNPTDTSNEAANARNAGITLFSIGIGSGIPMSELNDIATDPDSDHVFAVSSFSALAGIKAAFAAQACPAVNGNWGSWGSYGGCTVTCGGGTQSRSRSCDNPAPSNGGSTCSGSSTSSQSCNSGGCPVNGNWGSWGSYGGCSLTCGGGTQSRSRSCDSPAQAYGGAACAGSSSSSQSCNTHSCPIDGGFTSWSSWGTCSTTCELGSWSRSRSCTNPSPQHGGALCSGTTGQTTSCDLGPCPIDGVWGSWGSWGACSVTCRAIGTKIRTRACDSPAAQYGGAACPGSSSDSTSCDFTLTLCDPGNGWGPQVYATTAGTPVNGGFGSWTSWSGCSRTCGSGVTVRTRSCNSPVPKYGGTECSGDYFQKLFCSNVACSNLNNYTQTCPDNYLNCLDGTCVHYLSWCDCQVDCPDSSDEEKNYAGCMSEFSECTNRAGTLAVDPALVFLWASVLSFFVAAFKMTP